jgi:hypothetical protein
VCPASDQALEYLDKDREFLTRVACSPTSTSDAYIELKMEEVTALPHGHATRSSSTCTTACDILEAELRKEEAALESLKKDFNNGQPERRGDERNYQKYLDRVNEMKAALTRKEADVASLRRELSKFGGGGAK